MADVIHRDISDSERHEPKGASTATVGQVYVSNGSGGGTWGSVSDIKNVGASNEIFVANGVGGGVWKTVDTAVFPLAATYYDDVVVPVIGLQPGGPSTKPAVDATDGTWLFDSATTEEAATQIQLPHKWKEGTMIYPHIHWSKTTAAAGNVVWQLEYDIASPGGDFSGTLTPLAIVSTPVVGTVDNNTTTRHLITQLGTIDMTGHTISAVVKLHLSRIGGDVADTYGGDAKLLSFDIHIEVDTIGSSEEYTK